MTTSLTITFSSGSVTFSGTEILSASLVEQINPLSVEAPTNVIRFTVYSTTADFSILNPQGFYANLQYLEPFEVTETINGTPVYLGRFYLNTWTSESENRASFTAFDELGVLNDVPLKKEIIILGQEILTGVFSIGELIEELLATLFDSSVSYEIAIELYSVPAYGWYKSKQTYRDALCQLAFAGGAYVTCSRSNKILVRMFEFGYGTTETKIDERNAVIVYTGNWEELTHAGAYQTTLKAMQSVGTYPNTYFTFAFSGNRIRIDFRADLAGDPYGKFYVVIDGAAAIIVERSGSVSAYDYWISPLLSNGYHTVVVYGWVTGTEANGYSPIEFDAITTYEQSFVPAIYDRVIVGADKGTESPIDQKTLVTGVEVTAHNYTWDGASSVTLYKGTLGAGTYTIEFDEPHANFSATNATITFYGIDWITFTVATLAEVTITGREYVDSQTVFGIYTDSLPTGARENIIKITDVPFIHPTNAAEIAGRIYNYYQQRLIQKAKIFVPSDEVGDTVLIESQANRMISGIVERMETDLVGGFLSQVEIIGILFPCANVLTANLTITTTVNYVDCLNTFGYTITINTGGVLNIT